MSVAQQATTLMITNLRDELSRRRERVDKCREELEVAEADAEKFLAEVSASLGLRSRKAEKQYTPIERRKIVLNLYNAGKSNEEIRSGAEFISTYRRQRRDAAVGDGQARFAYEEQLFRPSASDAYNTERR